MVKQIIDLIKTAGKAAFYITRVVAVSLLLGLLLIPHYPFLFLKLIAATYESLIIIPYNAFVLKQYRIKNMKEYRRLIKEAYYNAIDQSSPL
jgi:hypothetical protein